MLGASKFGRFPKRITDIYEEVETYIADLVGKENAEKIIYHKLLSPSMDRIQNAVDKEREKITRFIDMELNHSM